MRSMSKEQIVSNLDIWRASGFPLAVSSCVLACCKGEQGGGPLSLYARCKVKQGDAISARLLRG